MLEREAFKKKKKIKRKQKKLRKRSGESEPSGTDNGGIAILADDARRHFAKVASLSSTCATSRKGISALSRDCLYYIRSNLDVSSTLLLVFPTVDALVDAGGIDARRTEEI